MRTEKQQQAQAKATAAAAERHRERGPSAAQAAYRGSDTIREHLAKVRPPLDPTAGAKAGWTKVREQGPTEVQRATWKANGERIAARNRTPEGRERLRQGYLNRTVLGDCVWCGEPATTTDHVFPRGPDLVPCCATCNASKSHRNPFAWLRAGLHGAGPVTLDGSRPRKRTAVIP